MLAMNVPQSRSFNPTNWYICCSVSVFTISRWVFEKFDGVRALWDNENRQFYTRWGNILPLPNFIEDSMPANLWLDGEVFYPTDYTVLMFYLRFGLEGTGERGTKHLD